jgi:hypothetical protein
MRTASASVSDHSEASNFLLDAPLATASSAARLKYVWRASAAASAAAGAPASPAVCCRSSSRMALSASTTLTADAASSAASTDDRPSRPDGAPCATPAASDIAARKASTLAP